MYPLDTRELAAVQGIGTSPHSTARRTSRRLPRQPAQPPEFRPVLLLQEQHDGSLLRNVVVRLSGFSTNRVNLGSEPFGPIVPPPNSVKTIFVKITDNAMNLQTDTSFKQSATEAKGRLRVNGCVSRMDQRIDFTYTHLKNLSPNFQLKNNRPRDWHRHLAGVREWKIRGTTVLGKATGLQGVGATLCPAVSLRCGSRPHVLLEMFAPLLRMAARTKPTNMGWGSSGRLVSSG